MPVPLGGGIAARGSLHAANFGVAAEDRLNG